MGLNLITNKKKGIYIFHFLFTLVYPFVRFFNILPVFITDVLSVIYLMSMTLVLIIYFKDKKASK